MITVSTNDNNDIFLDASGNLAMTSGVLAASQTAVHYAKTSKEEMIHNFDEGVPFFQTVFARDVSIPQFEAALRRRILSSPNIIAILSLNTAQDGELLTYTAEIKTTFGNGTING